MSFEPIKIIESLLGSDVINYLESSERLYLNTVSQKIQLGNLLDIKELEKLEMIFKKYKKYLD